MTIRKGLLLAALMVFTGRTLAAFPEKPIRIVVAFAPGSATDVWWRARSG